MITTHNLGFPRIGAKRELKFAQEAFWKGELSAEDLNLTAADMVVHFDPWWNPAVEAQATDRAYRIGQTKPVNVYKLVAKGTVEEKILKLQEQKKSLIGAAVDEGPETKRYFCCILTCFLRFL